jgi:hypothetical protein
MEETTGVVNVDDIPTTESESFSLTWVEEKNQEEEEEEDAYMEGFYGWTDLS